MALALTQGSLIVADPDARSSVWHLLWSLSPIGAVAVLAWGQIRVVHRSDERERLVQLSAMAVGFGVLIVALAVVGVLQGADIGDPRQQTQLSFVAGVLAWVASLGGLTVRSS